MAKPSVLKIARLGFPWATLRSTHSCSACITRMHIPRATRYWDPTRHWTAVVWVRTSLARRAGACTTDIRCPGSRHIPHRGFETVTIVRSGYIDHADSLGAAARFGSGDVQWLTAGQGVVHSEMFPLLNSSEPNPLELFQIWLNLPKHSKLAQPYFTMLWSENIPREVITDSQGATTEVTYIAGAPATTAIERSQLPPPDSWASEPHGGPGHLDHQDVSGFAVDIACGGDAPLAQNTLPFQGICCGDGR